ncbi:MAG: 6-pyruvoyl-tetrahydropterin synthase-related protein [Gammaproteobacteria bacterium]|nr:6-pyruvoyl-tetrahydropterin synthase-related protein [Gammaproteobacteria bacterium]
MFRLTFVYWWLIQLTSRLAALLGVILWFLLPYKLLLLLYGLYAFPPLMALTVFPLAMMFITSQNKPDRLFVAGLGLCLSLIILTHILSFLSFGFVLGVFFVLRAAIEREARPLIAFSLALIVALSISSFYWVPAVLQKAFVESSAFTDTESFQYAQNFLGVNRVHHETVFSTGGTL